MASQKEKHAIGLVEQIARDIPKDARVAEAIRSYVSDRFNPPMTQEGLKQALAAESEQAFDAPIVPLRDRNAPFREPAPRPEKLPHGVSNALTSLVELGLGAGEKTTVLRAFSIACQQRGMKLSGS